MSAYVIFNVTITENGWQERYLEPTARLVDKHGGKYIAMNAPHKLEGEREPPSVLVIIEFPSIDHATAWYSDPDYQPLIALRTSGADCEALMVAGK